MTLGGQPGNAPLANGNVGGGVYGQSTGQVSITATAGAGALTLWDASAVTLSPVGRSDGNAYVAVFAAVNVSSEFGGGWTYPELLIFDATWSSYSPSIGRCAIHNWEFGAMTGMTVFSVSPGSHTFKIATRAISWASNYYCNTYCLAAWEI